VSVFNQQHYIDFDAPAPAQRHSPTSVEAAKSQTKSKKDGDKQTIIAALELHGPLTDEQIVERTGIGANTVRPRRVELVREGLVQAVGEGRTVSGKRAVTWGRV
jgi:transcription initiation factor IIE alpha subunit